MDGRLSHNTSQLPSSDPFLLHFATEVMWETRNNVQNTNIRKIRRWKLIDLLRTGREWRNRSELGLSDTGLQPAIISVIVQPP